MGSHTDLPVGCRCEGCVVGAVGSARRDTPQGPSPTVCRPAAGYCCCCCCVVLTFFCSAALRAATSALYSSSDRSYQPIQAKPISSIVRCPSPTQFFGSGL